MALPPKSLGTGRNVMAAPILDQGREACQRAKELEPIVREMQGKGYSMRRMATAAHQAEGQNSRGGAWHPQTVKMVVRRLAA
jgi:hypothetical protein